MSVIRTARGLFVESKGLLTLHLRRSATGVPFSTTPRRRDNWNMDSTSSRSRPIAVPGPPVTLLPAPPAPPDAPEKRARAARELANMGAAATSALPALEKATKDSNSEVSAAAKQAIAAIRKR